MNLGWRQSSHEIGQEIIHTIIKQIKTATQVLFCFDYEKINVGQNTAAKSLC